MTSAAGSHVFVVEVEDEPGVLTRVSSLFRRRGFNIVSLTVGVTERPGVSRMTIVVDAPGSGGAPDRGAPLEARQRHPGRGRDRRRRRPPRAGDGEGGRRRRGEDARDEARRGLPRPRHRRRARVADSRVDRHERQDCRAARRAAPFGLLEVARSGHVAMVRGVQAQSRESDAAVAHDNVTYSV